MSAADTPKPSDSPRQRWVTTDGVTQLPDAMVAELKVGQGAHVWFLRGPDRWEAWTESELSTLLGQTVAERIAPAPCPRCGEAAYFAGYTHDPPDRIEWFCENDDCDLTPPVFYVPAPGTKKVRGSPVSIQEWARRAATNVVRQLSFLDYIRVVDERAAPRMFARLVDQVERSILGTPLDQAEPEEVNGEDKPWKPITTESPR